MRIAPPLGLSGAASAILSFLIALQLSAPAGAAESSTGQDASGASLTEVVVSARKRDERLQDVPAAISALTDDAIEAAGVRSIDDVALLVPNLSIANSQNVGTVFINIRGVGQYRNSEPPVAMIIDGVQISSPNQITQDLYDIERIEVLKGPQGFLYGRNASGGAINIVTKAPGTELEGMVRGTYGNGQDLRADAVLSGPVIQDRLSVRLAASYRDFDGVLNNVTRGEKADFLTDKNFRLRAIAKPHEALSFDLRFSYSSFDGSCCYFIPLEDDHANDFSVPIQADARGAGTRDLHELALKVDYEMPIGTLTSVTAATSVEELFFEDLDWTPLPILTADQDLETRTWSQELRIASPGAQRLRWMAGAFYLHTRRDLETFVDLVDVLRFSVGDIRDDNRAWALFGNLEYDLTERLSLTLGLRYDEDQRQQIDTLQSGLVSRATFDELQPKISLSRRLNERMLGYVSYSSGFRSGGFNATETFGRQYQAEVVESSEIGFKSSWSDGRVVFNAAAFHSKFENLQQYVLDVNSGGQAIVTVPSAMVQGLELELQARPAPRLLMFASLGLQDTKIESELAGFDPDAVGYPPGFTFVGKKVPLVYEWSYALGAQYSARVSQALELTVRGDYSGRGGNFWEANNFDRQDAVHLVNLSATLRNGNFAVSLWAKNLFDEKYFEEFVSREFAGTIFDVAFPAATRRYGITASMRF
jgi:iron complex outermembrane receptor protein